MKGLILLLLVTGSALLAQTARVVDGAGAQMQIAAAGALYDSGILTMTTGATVITAVTTRVQIIACNTTGAATTITITDGANVQKATTVAIGASTVTIINYGAIGLSYSGGVKITAGANSTLNCQVVGVQ